MKSLLWVSLLAFFVSACSKEENTELPVEESAAVVEEATEEAPADTAESSDTEDEVLEVVEESAAEAEPDDQAIVLARADNTDIAEAAARNWTYKEGSNFTRMVPTQPTYGGPDKIEVAEVFMYSCPHCFTLESYINEWDKTKDPEVRFVRIPAMFNQLAQLHAQLYFTEVFLAQSGKIDDYYGFRNMVFDEFHRRGNRLASETAIQRLFVRAGVSEDDFQRTWKSFEVNQAMRLSQDLTRRYGIQSVPTMIVNGKYRTDAASAGSYPKLIELIDELTEREGLRR